MAPFIATSCRIASHGRVGIGVAGRVRPGNFRVKPAAVPYHGRPGESLTIGTGGWPQVSAAAAATVPPGIRRETMPAAGGPPLPGTAAGHGFPDKGAVLQALQWTIDQ